MKDICAATCRPAAVLQWVLRRRWPWWLLLLLLLLHMLLLLLLLLLLVPVFRLGEQGRVATKVHRHVLHREHSLSM